MIACLRCGKEFKAGNNPVTGVGFRMEDGKKYHFCSMCISYHPDECVKLVPGKGESSDRSVLHCN